MSHRVYIDEMLQIIKKLLNLFQILIGLDNFFTWKVVLVPAGCQDKNTVIFFFMLNFSPIQFESCYDFISRVFFPDEKLFETFLISIKNIVYFLSMSSRVRFFFPDAKNFSSSSDCPASFTSRRLLEMVFLSSFRHTTVRTAS